MADWSVQLYGGWEPEPMATIGSTRFMGVYDSNKWYDYGDICLRDGSLWICTKENRWEELGASESVSIYKCETKPVIMPATNCPNCGAPIYNGRCLYCKTIVFEN